MNLLTHSSLHFLIEFLDFLFIGGMNTNKDRFDSGSAELFFCFNDLTLEYGWDFSRNAGIERQPRTYSVSLTYLFYETSK